MNNDSRVRVGEVQSFLFKNKMTPFKVDRIIETKLKLVSLDLRWTSEIFVSDWMKQKEILSRVEE